MITTNLCEHHTVENRPDKVSTFLTTLASFYFVIGCGFKTNPKSDVDDLRPEIPFQSEASSNESSQSDPVTDEFYEQNTPDLPIELGTPNEDASPELKTPSATENEPPPKRKK